MRRCPAARSELWSGNHQSRFSSSRPRCYITGITSPRGAAQSKHTPRRCHNNVLGQRRVGPSLVKLLTGEAAGLRAAKPPRSPPGALRGLNDDRLFFTSSAAERNGFSRCVEQIYGAWENSSLRSPGGLKKTDRRAKDRGREKFDDLNLEFWGGGFLRSEDGEENEEERLTCCSKIRFYFQ